MSGKVLVVGGRGFFGRLLVEELLRETDADVVVGGRRAEGFKEGERLTFARVDLSDSGRVAQAVAGMDAAVCAAGPFQGLPMSLPRACLAQDVPYLDLADDRGFVGRARALAKPGGPTFFPGCSTSPALSAALAAVAGAARPLRVTLAVGNAVGRQEAVFASLLASVGAPVRLRGREAVGWTEPRVFPFPPPVGPRTGWLVDVADHDLLPEAEFRVAPEFSLMGGALRTFGRVLGASGLSLAASALSGFGHDWGALGVEGARRVSLVADHGGPRMAVMPVVIMLRRILAKTAPRGLVSLDDWLPRAELEVEAARRGFRLVVEDHGR